MRALRVAVVVAIGCVAASCEDKERALGEPSTEADAGSETGGKAITCCKLDLPSCHCPVSGTNADGSCRRVPCDVVPLGWTTAIDERGCPYYDKTNSESCLARPPPETDPGDDRNVGTTCTRDYECDLSSRAVTMCSSMQFGDATGACFRTGCDAEASGASCDSGRGFCLAIHDDGGTCLPRCVFDDSGTPPVGCLGRTVCHYRWRDPVSSRGVGFCLGGCTGDADCAAGWKCSREYGVCTRTTTITPPSKAVGDACTTSDRCWCNGGSSAAGYCTQFCRVGAEGACPTAFTCDPELPLEFTRAPTDLAGRCAKICTTDPDCAALNATCVAAGGLTVKVCRPK